MFYLEYKELGNSVIVSANLHGIRDTDPNLETELTRSRLL